MKEIMNIDLGNQKIEPVSIEKKTEEPKKFRMPRNSISVAENCLQSMLFKFMRSESKDSKTDDCTSKPKKKIKRQSNFNAFSLSKNHRFSKFNIKPSNNIKHTKPKRISLIKLKKKYENLENSAIKSEKSESSKNSKKKGIKKLSSNKISDFDKNSIISEKEKITKNKYYSIIPQAIKKIPSVEGTIRKSLTLKQKNKID